MHQAATGSTPVCRQCQEPIDVAAMGFVDLTRPLCARCSGAPDVPALRGDAVVDLTSVADAAAPAHEPTAPLSHGAGRLFRAPVLRDLVRSVASGRTAATRPDPGPALAESAVGAAPSAEARHGLAPDGTIDLRDGSPVVAPPAPTIWTDPEERTALRALLNRTRPLGIEVLHDRKPVGALHPIDHIVVAPSGVWVIDSMGETGQVQGCEATDFLRPAWRLLVGGVDRTVLLDDVRRWAGMVRNVLVASGEGRVPVRPLLCFSDAALGSVTPPFVMAGVLVTSRRHVVEPFSIAPGLDRAARRWVRDILADHLPRPG